MLAPTRVNRTLFVDPFDSVQRDLGSLLARNLMKSTSAGNFLNPVDVREDTDHVYVDAELPGLKKEEIEITLENQMLTIIGQHKESEQTKGEWLLKERRPTRFERSFKLPPTISEQSVDAKLQDGVLTITLKKREESKPRKIAVS